MGNFLNKIKTLQWQKNSKNRRKKKKGKKMKKKKWLTGILILAILSMITTFGMEKYKESQIGKNKEDEYSNNLSYQTQNLSTSNIQIYPKEDFITQYKGYEVIAKLVIPDIQLETYILEKYSKSALNVCVTKFWGANPNKIGNFCVAGHNFQNKNMFYHLEKLNKGNSLFISDREVGKVEYQIYDIFLVKPEEVSCLSQETKGKREVTLITCTKDSVKRVIVKAQEKT